MSQTLINQQKSQLRKRLRQARLALSAHQVKVNSQAVISHLLTSKLWPQAEHIALYLPFNNEIDLQVLLDQDKNYYLPSISGQNMQFHRYSTDMSLMTTTYGLQQPKFKSQHPEPDLDLCLMPLLAFDYQGNRLGMGGGFYDRYFGQNNKTQLIGVAHALQQIIQLPTEPWDVKLNAIITEQGFIQL